MHYNKFKAYVAVHHYFLDQHKVEFRGSSTLPEEQRLQFDEQETSSFKDDEGLSLLGKHNDNYEGNADDYSR